MMGYIAVILYYIFFVVLFSAIFAMGQPTSSSVVYLRYYIYGILAIASLAFLLLRFLAKSELAEKIYETIEPLAIVVGFFMVIGAGLSISDTHNRFVLGEAYQSNISADIAFYMTVMTPWLASALAGAQLAKWRYASRRTTST